VLNLDRKRLWPPPGVGPLVVVDDCSYTGTRLGWFLDTVNSREVVFAHLYSHPDLRSAVLASEPRVIACISAGDLRDGARDDFPDEQEYLRWQERCRQRLPGKRYWFGRPELVVFPWTEPDRPVFNPASGEHEDYWRFTPPDRCLGNWARLGIPPQSHVRPTLRSPDHVAFKLQEDKVILCDLRTEGVYGLEDVAAAMWRAIAAYGDADAALRHLLACYEVEEAVLRRDLERFVADLLARGLFEPVPGSAQDTPHPAGSS
jgi:hypothetical protein